MRLHNRDGTLIDVSEGGALVRLPMAQAAGSHVVVQIEWKGTFVSLKARVVRSVTHRVQLRDAVLSRREHHVAVEFIDPAPEAAQALTEMTREP